MLLAATAFAQTPAPASPSAPALLAAARAALGPPVRNLQLRGAFRLQLPNSSRQQQGELQIRLLWPSNYQRQITMRLPFGEFVTTETLAHGDATVRRQVPPAMAARFAAFRRNGAGHLTAAQREQFRQRRQARLLRSISTEADLDALSFLLQPSPGATLRYAGLAQARSGQQADMIAVTVPGQKTPVTLFLDRHTHRLLMLSYTGYAYSIVRARRPRRFGGASSASPGPPTPAPGPSTPAPRPPRRPVMFYVHFTHWHRVAGHWFPFEITRSMGAATISEWDLQKVRLNSPHLTAQTFSQQ